MTTMYFKDLFTMGLPFHIADTILRDNGKTNAHNHDFCEFFIVNKGNLIYNLNGIDYEISEKCLCLSFPTDIHYFQKGKDSDRIVFTNIAFQKEWLDEVILLYEKEFKLFDFQPWKTVISLTPEMLSVFTNKIELLKKLPKTSNDIKIIVFKSLLIDLLIQFSSDNNQEKMIAPEWLSSAYKEMEKPENFISGLNMFIHLCGKTQEHISRMMKKYYNLTPSEYINSLRLQQATKLLIASDQSITDIIYEVGFNNASYFNGLFKDKYALTAKDYRKINRRIINP